MVHVNPQVVALHASSKSGGVLGAGAVLEAGAAVSAEALTAIETRQQQHDADIELLMTEVGVPFDFRACHCLSSSP